VQRKENILYNSEDWRAIGGVKSGREMTASGYRLFDIFAFTLLAGSDTSSWAKECSSYLSSKCSRLIVALADFAVGRWKPVSVAHFHPLFSGIQMRKNPVSTR
jgi:hypothetical protein